MADKKKKSAIETVWDTLCSTNLFCALSLLIAFWMIVLLLVYPKFIPQINEMNERVLFEWMLYGTPESAFLRGWLAALCIIAAALGANLTACLINDVVILTAMMKKKAGNRQIAAKISVLLMHLAYVTILTGHLISSSTGCKVAYDIEPGITYKSEKVPFSMKCTGIKNDMHPKSGMTVDEATFTLAGGAFNGKNITIGYKTTVRSGGYLFSLNSRRDTSGIAHLKPGSKQAPAKQIPWVRVVRNPGIDIIISGGILFFLGTIARMLTRPWETSKKHPRKKRTLPTP